MSVTDLVPHQAWPEDWLSQQALSGRHVWAIVDASASEAIAHVRKLEAGHDCTNLLDHITSDPSALVVAPRVVPVSPEGRSSALRAIWQSQETDEPMLFLIASAWSPQMWVPAMRRRMRARFTDGEHMLFRWWDARIWWALHEPELHQHADVQALLAAEAASAWPGRDGQLQTAENPAADSDPTAHETAWALSDPTFAGLLKLGHADAVLGLCRSDYPSALNLVPPAHRHALACVQVRWAQGQGFESPDDHALAVRIAAEVGPGWAGEPEWAEVVSQAVASGQTLRSTLAQA